MDPFVRRLVERLHDPSRPLSRNRHFHTFATPEGRLALKLHRRLKSLQRDILACVEEGRSVRLSRRVDASGENQLELQLERIQGRRVSMLKDAELELLAQLPGMREVLEGALG